MWYDADIDRLMRRTAKRPIPAGRLTAGEALAFGLPLAVGSVVFLGLAANVVAAGLLAFTIFFYVVVYTMWLKRSTPQNIVIGGAAGALPPMIGWAAVTGGVSLESLVLFLIIFLWTPPHFWALSLYKCDDYARPACRCCRWSPGEASTKRQILVYSVVLAVASALPPPLARHGDARLRRLSPAVSARSSSGWPGVFSRMPDGDGQRPCRARLVHLLAPLSVPALRGAPGGMGPRRN